MSDKELIENRLDQINITKDKLAEQAVTHDKMHNKMFAILGLEVALAGVLSYDGFKLDKIDTRLEWILLYIAIAAVGLSAATIFMNYRARRIWPTPLGVLEVERMNNAKNRLAALDILYADMRETYERREGVLGEKARYLNAALSLFVISVIILVLIKIGG